MDTRNIASENSICRALETLNFILDALCEFEGKFHKKFNFSKLAEYLEIPKVEFHAILSLILKFQEKFASIFKYYRLQKQEEGSTVYLVAERVIKPYLLPDTIFISRMDANLLSDIIYTFKFVRRGKGFDFINNGSKLLSGVKRLNQNHYYLFNSNGNGLIYPSELGLELGNKIQLYNKSNRKVNKIPIGETTVIIGDTDDRGK